ncbi:hypothetical protein DSO57_1036740 [Entomophthora muscae]|uniref:Uncharacterized protein n=2 Tax=Entomophthora muscae TaxID=34485 RepID=A0ACC2UL46_9FUNG|nr:hypothetical protein DSO57_1036740 [Entomophthora muscae]
MAPSHPFATPPSSGAGLNKFDSLFEESSTRAGARSRAATMSPPMNLVTKPSIPNFGERPGSFTAAETLAFEELFNQTEGLSQGYITGDQAVPLFQRSGLDSTTLSQIWQLADSKGEGLLRLASFKVAMKLISLAQARRPVTLAYLHEPCPLPLFDGVRLSFGPAARLNDDIRLRASPFDPKPASPFEASRTISLSDAQKYYRIFLKASFNQDLLDGNAVRDIMVKTGLHIGTLRDIWNIADTQGRGSLEAFEFIIAMFYVENILNETIHEVPALLPPKIKDSAISAMTSLASSPPSRHVTFPTSTSSLSLGPQKEDWAIPAADLLKYASFFDAIVPLPTGLMSSEEAYKFFIRSKLSSPTLSAIWELSSILNQDGLTRDEFAVAMHLIYATMNGAPLPRQLPRELIPPSLRQPDPFLQAGPPQPFDPFLSKELPLCTSPLPQDLLSFDNHAAPIAGKDDGCRDDILALNSQLKPLIQDINASRIKKAQLLGQNKTMQMQEEALQTKHRQEQDLHSELTRELTDLELLHKELLPIHSSTREKHGEHQERFRNVQAKYAALETQIQEQLAKSSEAKKYVQASQPIIAHLTNQLKALPPQPPAEAEDPFTALIERIPSPRNNPETPKENADPFSDFPSEKNLTTLSFDELVAARSAPLKRGDSTSSHASQHSRVESRPAQSANSFPPQTKSPTSDLKSPSDKDLSTKSPKPEAEVEADPFTALISESSNNFQASSPIKPTLFRTQEDLANYFSKLDLETDLIQLELTPSKEPEAPTLTYTAPSSLFDTFATTFPAPVPLNPPVPQKASADPFLDLTSAPEPASTFDRAFGEKRSSGLGTFSFDDIFGESFTAAKAVDPAQVPLPESASETSFPAETPNPLSPAGLRVSTLDDNHSVSVYFDAEDEMNRHLSSPPPPSISTVITSTLMRSATSDSSLPKVDAAAMHELLGMGFTSSQAAEALSKCDNNLELATNHLLDGAPDSSK